MNSVLKAWADVPPIFADRLMALLTDGGRIFHGLHHVNALLLEADRVCDPHWLRPLRWAILYHVAIHDPLASASANRQASEELWREHFPAILETVRGVSGQWDEDVAVAIRATATPFARADALLPWQHALIDLHCGGLGAAPALYEADHLRRFTEFTRAGGAETAWSTDRLGFLTSAIACPTLFFRVHADREQTARANLRRELMGMTQP